jgi:HNH endonuclease
MPPPQLDPLLATALHRFITSRGGTDFQRAVEQLAASNNLIPERFRDVASSLDVETVRKELIPLLMYYIRLALADDDLTTEELATVRYLKRLFRVPDGAIVDYDKEDVEELLTGQIVRILADERVDPAEAVQEVRLQEAFDLGYDQFLEITRPLIHAVVRHWLDNPREGEDIQDLEGRVAKLNTVFSVDTVLDEITNEVFAGIDEQFGGAGDRGRHISQDVKDRVWRRDQGRCVQCGSQDRLEFDHIIPFAKGGANTYRNVQLLCESCNRQKSDSIG